MTQQGPASKSGKEIIPLDCRHEYHGCLWMPLSSCAVTGEKEAVLEHSSASPDADARTGCMDSYPFCCLAEGSTWARSSDLMCTSFVFRSSEINHTASTREPCRPSRWTSPADLLLWVHDNLLLGSESSCLGFSLNIRRTNLHKGRSVL